MKCERCGENPGEIRYTEYVDGEARKSTICSSCAEELGFGPVPPRAVTAGPRPTPKSKAMPPESAVVFSTAGLADDPVLSGLRCPGCGVRGAELRNSTLLACPQCYETFGSHLAPVLQRIHGAQRHRGRLPRGRHSEGGGTEGEPT